MDSSFRVRLATLRRPIFLRASRKFSKHAATWLFLLNDEGGSMGAISRRGGRRVKVNREMFGSVLIFFRISCPRRSYEAYVDSSPTIIVPVVESSDYQYVLACSVSAADCMLLETLTMA